MDDLISRRAAIDKLKSKIDKKAKGEIGTFYNTVILKVIESLESLPSVQPDKEVEYWHELCDSYELTIVKLSAVIAEQLGTQWIPCSERLPEESDGTVLVCFPDEFPYSNKEPYINAKHNQRVKTATYSQFNKT